MATFLKLDSGLWQVKIRIQGHPQITRTFTTKASAQAFAVAKEKDIINGVYSDERATRKMELSEAFDTYFNSLTFNQKQPKTQAQERLSAKRLLTELKGYSVANINPVVVSDYRDKSARAISPRTGKPVSANTIRLDLATLSILFSYLITERRLPLNNPVRDVIKPRVKNREARLTDQQARQIETALLARNDNGQLANFVAIAIGTGMRAGEIVNLTTDNVSERDGVPVLYIKGIDSKSALHRTVPLPVNGKAYKAIQAQLAIKPQESRYLFFKIKKSGEFDKYDYNTVWRKLKISLGFHDLHFHDLRHEFISRLYEHTNLSDGQISSITGHTDVRTLKIYQHNRSHTLVDDLAKAENQAHVSMIKRLVDKASAGDKEAFLALNPELKK